MSKLKIVEPMVLEGVLFFPKIEEDMFRSNFILKEKEADIFEKVLKPMKKQVNAKSSYRLIKTKINSEDLKDEYREAYKLMGKTHKSLQPIKSKINRMEVKNLYEETIRIDDLRSGDKVVVYMTIVPTSNKKYKLYLCYWIKTIIKIKSNEIDYGSRSPLTDKQKKQADSTLNSILDRLKQEESQNVSSSMIDEPFDFGQEDDLGDNDDE